MAVIALGPTVVGIRGTVGGITFTNGRSGPYCKAWVQGLNPQTSKQQVVRGGLSQYGALWRGLSDADRTAWDYFGLHPPEVDYNRVGHVVYLSGWHWLTRVNQRRHSVGLGLVSAVPAAVAVSPPTGFGLTAGQLPGGTVAASWAAGSFPGGTSAVLMLSVYTTSGSQLGSKSFALVWGYHNPPGTSVVITSQVQGLFGSIRAGWKLAGRLYCQRDDGVRSVAGVAICVVV